MEIRDSAVNALDVVEGNFSDSDRLVTGLGAMTFDGTDAVDSYVLWLRHEGRRWLDFELGTPVDVTIDGKSLALDQIRASQPFVGGGGRFFEKIELELSAADLERVLESGDATIILSSATGTVRKTLTTEELELMREFAEKIEAQLIGSRIS